MKSDKLKVVAANLVHEQHLMNLQTFNHYPENMRLTKEEESVAKTMVTGDGKKQKIKSHLMKLRIDQGISAPISLKSVRNVQNKCRLEREKLCDGSSELEKLLATMMDVPGAKVRVVRENNELIAIYFQDPRMQAFFDKYPEVLLYDATYKLNSRNMPVFIQSVVDGNGQTEIVTIWICKSESTVVAQSMLSAFKEFNPSWKNVICIIGDKDFADRWVPE